MNAAALRSTPQKTWRAVLRWLLLLLAAFLALQLYFVLRVAAMAVIDPSSTAFERSQLWQVVRQDALFSAQWRQEWIEARAQGRQLPRAVIASEDAGFVQHCGVDWDSVEKAWSKNQVAQARAEQRAARTAPPPRKGKEAKPAPQIQAKVVGGSTITQQLAKNLFLSSERTLLRKGQELLITLTLELFLSKERILEIYLNHVEWGRGVFGAEAAAQHYFRKPAAQLSAYEAARLAVMLPRPRTFERLPQSPYLHERASVIAARMGDVRWP